MESVQHLIAAPMVLLAVAGGIWLATVIRRRRQDRLDAQELAEDLARQAERAAIRSMAAKAYRQDRKTTTKTDPTYEDFSTRSDDADLLTSETTQRRNG